MANVVKFAAVCYKLDEKGINIIKCKDNRCNGAYDIQADFPKSELPTEFPKTGPPTGLPKSELPKGFRNQSFRIEYPP